MPEVVLLDTHIWLWLINGNFEKFPSQWRDQIESADRVGVSPVSCYEIALAHDMVGSFFLRRLKTGSAVP